jgi:hypothetical protein
MQAELHGCDSSLLVAATGRLGWLLSMTAAGLNDKTSCRIQFSV